MVSPQLSFMKFNITTGVNRAIVMAQTTLNIYISDQIYKYVCRSNTLVVF